MLGTLLVALVAIFVAILGCVVIAPTRWLLQDREGANDDVR